MELRNESQIRSYSNQYNAGTIAKQQIHEEVNSAYNHHPVITAFKAGRAMDIGDWRDKHKKENAIIIGSGPSLDYILPYLKDWEGGIICSTSHARTLIYFGVEPDYIVALDPFASFEEIEGVDWSKTKTVLVAQPGVWPDLIEKWPNQLLMYIPSTGKKDSFYATTMKRMYSWRDEKTQGTTRREPVFNFYIRTEIVLYACTPALQLFVGNILGYKKYYLAGCDFGYTNNKSRFTEYYPPDYDPEINMGVHLGDLKKDQWRKAEVPDYVPTEDTVVGGNGVLTEGVHLYYKKNFYSAWRLSKCSIRTMDKGLCYEIPYADVSAVMKSQGNMKPVHMGEVIRITENYLALLDTFVIYSGIGDQALSFVEADNPVAELTIFMKEIYSTYLCDACKSQIKYNLEHPDQKKLIEQKRPAKEIDELRATVEVEDHNGEECPYCHKGKLSRIQNINVKKNIERIKKLLRKRDAAAKK